VKSSAVGKQVTLDAGNHHQITKLQQCNKTQIKCTAQRAVMSAEPVSLWHACTSKFRRIAGALMRGQ
jgi:hypothetical protein